MPKAYLPKAVEKKERYDTAKGKVKQTLTSLGAPDWFTKLNDIFVDSTLGQVFDPLQNNAGPLVARMPFPHLRKRAEYIADSLTNKFKPELVNYLKNKFPRALGQLEKVSTEEGATTGFSPSWDENISASDLAEYLMTGQRKPSKFSGSINVDVKNLPPATTPEKVLLHELGHSASSFSPTKEGLKSHYRDIEDSLIDTFTDKGIDPDIAGQLGHEYITPEINANAISLKHNYLSSLGGQQLIPGFRNIMSPNARNTLEFDAYRGIPLNRPFMTVNEMKDILAQPVQRKLPFKK